MQAPEGGGETPPTRGACLAFLAGCLHAPLPLQIHISASKTVAGGAGNQLQADLVDMRNISKANSGVRFLLTAFDVVSRKKNFLKCLNSKRGNEVAGTLKLMATSGTRVSQTNKVKGFYNSQVQQVCKKIRHEPFFNK